MFELFDLDRLVNSYFYHNQENPHMAALTSGNYAIAWQSGYQDLNYQNIYAKVMDKNDKTVKAEFLVNQTWTSTFYFKPRVVALTSGKFCIIYKGVAGINFGSDLILGSMFWNNGTVATAESNSMMNFANYTKSKKTQINKNVQNINNFRNIKIKKQSDENTKYEHQLELSQIDFEMLEANKVQNIEDYNNEKINNNFKENSFLNNNNNSLNDHSRVIFKLNKNLNSNKNNDDNINENSTRELIEKNKLNSIESSREKEISGSNKIIHTFKNNDNKEVNLIRNHVGIFSKKKKNKYINKNKFVKDDRCYEEKLKYLEARNRIYMNNGFTSIRKLEEYIEKVDNYKNNLFMANETEIFLKGKKEIINKPKNFIVDISARSYIFPCNDSSIYSCQKISIIEVSVQNYIVNILKSYIKIVVIGIIYLFLWFYIAVFVESIYKQYGKKRF